MTAEQNQSTFARFAEIWNTGNTAGLEDCVADSYVRHDPGLPMEVRGPEALRQLMAMYRSAIPDLTFDVVLSLADGDYIGVVLLARGTHQGELMGIAPTGRSLAVHTSDFFRFEDGKIVEQWAQVDNLGLLQQLGALPAPA